MRYRCDIFRVRLFLFVIKSRPGVWLKWNGQYVQMPRGRRTSIFLHRVYIPMRRFQALEVNVYLEVAKEDGKSECKKNDLKIRVW